MNRKGGKLSEDLLAWLEKQDSLKGNPQAQILIQSLQENVAANKRTLLAVSESSGYAVTGLTSCRKIVTSSTDSQLDSSLNGNGTVKNSVNVARYKTELCRSFSENGVCRYGDKCQFAHGIMDLRQTSRHPRYKTELCKAYHMSGFCPYGARCNFIHNDIEPLNDPLSSRSEQIANDVVKSSSLNVAKSSSLAQTMTCWDRDRTKDVVWPPMLALGSTADSPPMSVTDSPAPSPTTMLFDPAFDSFPSLWASLLNPKQV